MAKGKGGASFGNGGGGDDPRKRVANLRQLDLMFRQIPADLADWFKVELVEWELNFKPVGRISGNLARSVHTESRDYSAVVKVNADGKAPYAADVNYRVEGRFGEGYLELALNRNEEIISNALKSEFHRAVKKIESGGRYVYRNPFG